MRGGAGVALFLVTVAGATVARAEPPSDKRSSELEKRQAEKKGALHERVDPARDLEAQEANIKRLRKNAEIERRNGNRVAAWAAEADARHAEKLARRDRKLLQSGARKQEVDGKATTKE